MTALTVSVWAISFVFGALLGSVFEKLTSIHKELVKIRLAAESLHDRIIPEVMTSKLIRDRQGK